jgi:hypothetical protein
MTKTQPPRTTEELKRSRWPMWGLAVLVVAVIGVGLYLAFARQPDPTVETTATTVAPQTTATTTGSDVDVAANLATIEAGVAAFYGGDAERAAELFDLQDRTDDQIRAESAYQAAIGGRLNLNCTGGTDGVFRCSAPYHNKMTDALGFTDHGDVNQVVVADGVITEFAFPEHSWLVLQVGTFLALEGRFDGYGDCGFGPFPASCATIQLENLDDYVEWRKTPLDAAGIVEVTLGAWYGGDCEQATFLSLTQFLDDPGADDCASGSDQPSSFPVRITAYESILGAEVAVEGCEQPTGGDPIVLSCEVHYSNAMSRAVGKPAAVTTREFGIIVKAVVTDGSGEQPWYRIDYPEDAELRESFRQFAEEGDLNAEFTDAGCATNRTEVCANLIMDNLDDWAAWHKTTG